MIVYHCFYLCISFFFFQAEDGIRDHCVTGVQTCALPISKHDGKPYVMRAGSETVFEARDYMYARLDKQPKDLVEEPRSEERRVGKECRSRGSPYHKKKNKWKSTRAMSIVVENI